MRPSGLGVASTALPLAALSVLLGAPAAHAHGSFIDGSPGPGDAVPAGSRTLTLQFEEIDPGSRAALELSRTGGEPEALGAALALDDAGAVCARSEPLSEGIYTLRYEVTSPDGSVAESACVFEGVGAAEATDFVSAGPCAGGALRPPAPPAASTADSDSLAPLIAVVSAVGVAVVAGVLVAVRRQQER